MRACVVRLLLLLLFDLRLAVFPILRPESSIIISVRPVSLLLHTCTLASEKLVL